MSISSSSFRPFILAALAFAAIGLFMLIPGEAESSGLGQTGHFEWVDTPYARSQPSNCPAGYDCWENCFVGPDGIMGTGQLCCVDQYGVCQEDLRG